MRRRTARAAGHEQDETRWIVIYTVTKILLCPPTRAALKNCNSELFFDITLGLPAMLGRVLQKLN